MLSDTIATARLALKVRRHGSRSLNAVVSQVEASADSAAIAHLAEKVAPVYRQDPTSAAKYAKPRHWLLLNTLRVADLGLHTTSGLRILDIGCGPGYFLALARALGHECYGVDAPDSYLSGVERDVYATLTGAFHCRDFVSPLLIERFQPLPFHEQPFDLITAFWICFNRHRQPDEWGAGEWKFFVDDALTCLRPGGRLVLHLNEHAERYGDLRFYDAALRNYFCSVGSADNGRVTIARP